MSGGANGKCVGSTHTTYQVARTPMTLHCAVKPAIISGIILMLAPVLASAQSGSRYIKQAQGDQSVIVFVHGIFGDSVSTWTNRNGAYWPSLLASDPFFSPYDVYVYEFASRFVGTGFSIDEIAENMRLTLDTDHVSDYKEIIFVSHSMGGLITRAYLNKNRAVADRVQLAYFYSTPTTGSELASIASLVSTNPQIAKMKPTQSDEYLADLQRQWLANNFQIPSFCAYEKQSTYGVKIVTQASASNLCNRRLDPIDSDHMGIVKPADTRDTPYLALKVAIQQTPLRHVSSEPDFNKVTTWSVSFQIFVVTQEYSSDVRETAFVFLRQCIFRNLSSTQARLLDIKLEIPTNDPDIPVVTAGTDNAFQEYRKRAIDEGWADENALGRKEALLKTPIELEPNRVIEGTVEFDIRDEKIKRKMWSASEQHTPWLRLELATISVTDLRSNMSKTIKINEAYNAVTGSVKRIGERDLPE
jgi:triacylglycerol esterase/lipase EstA (alpha/beta hydrolase family)